MPTLIVTPSSRALREASKILKEKEGMLPRLMRIDEFLSRLCLVPDRGMIQETQRIFRLREAAEFEGFERIHRERDLIRFFSRSGDFFRFFEELAWEKVPLESLEEADAYAEYAEHIELLARLKGRYEKILESQGLYDRMSLPQLYRFNTPFVQRFDRIVLHLEGYLSRFEMELLGQVASQTSLELEWRSTPYNEKMRRRFEEEGIELPPLSRVRFSWSEKRILEHRTAELSIAPKVMEVQERYEQVALALAEIEKMVREGIPPERIALVLPREDFKKAFRLYDRMGNLNFSMGFDLKDRPEYQWSHGLLRWWSGRGERDREWLERLGAGEVTALSGTHSGSAEEFFRKMAEAGMPGFAPGDERSRVEEPLEELRYRFLRLHGGRTLRDKEWLFLWLRELEELRLDDVGGGKVTVMGVLETRGVAFDGVVLVDFNDGIVPAATGKDRFLDSRVRHFAGLPDRQDREALQKHYYARLLERAKSSVILYSRSDNRLPSRFLYELGLEEGRPVAAPRELLYRHDPLPPLEEDPVVERFEPTGMLWSASRLKTWLECPRRFYYRYIRGLEEKASDEINEGLVLHRILDELYRGRDSFDDVEQMRKELEKITAGVLAGEEIRGLYLGRYWKEMLREFSEKEVEHFRQGWRIEARELRVEGEIRGLRFAGRIDRLDRRGGEYLAVDYKSGSIRSANRKSSLDRLSDFQMSIYRILLRPHYPQISTAFVPILEGGGYVELSASEEKEALLLEHLEALRKTDTFVAECTSDLSLCRYCPYQLLCGRGEYL